MVVAPTNVGKSMLLSMMAAEAWWAGGHSMYFTYELTPEQIQHRIALATLGKGKNMVHDTWPNELDWVMRQRGLSALPNSRLEIHDSEDAGSWPDIEMQLERFGDAHGTYPQVIFLDSADDVPFRGKFEKRHEGLTDTYTYLRNLAHEKNIAIWSTGQLNQNGDSQDGRRLSESLSYPPESREFIA